MDRAWVAKPKPPDREYGSLCLKNASCLGWSKCQYSCCSYAAISRSNAPLYLIFRSGSFLSRVRSAPPFFGAWLPTRCPYMLQAYGHFKLVPSHLAFRFYRLACWWALSLGFCDSSNRSSTLEHKRTASLYRIALALWYPIGLPRRYLYRYLVRINLLAHLVFGLIYFYYSPVARLMSFIGFSAPGTRYPLFCLCLFQIKTSCLAPLSTTGESLRSGISLSLKKRFCCC